MSDEADVQFDDPEFAYSGPAVVDNTFTSTTQRENVRSFIATLFVGGYLAIVVFLIVLNTFYKLGSESVKDYLLAIGSPLGFVIGFYFKTVGQGD